MSLPRTLTYGNGAWDKLRRPGEPNYKKCRFCGGACTGRRTSFCSNDHAHEWAIRSSSSYARQCVRRRDKGVCAKCGLDTYALRAKLYRLAHANHRRFVSFMARFRLPVMHTRYRIYIRGVGSEGVEVKIKSLWEMDHILQVAEGGGACGLENLRTLCIFCHRKATAAYAAHRAQRRRIGASRQQPNIERALTVKNSIQKLMLPILLILGIGLGILGVGNLVVAATDTTKTTVWAQLVGASYVASPAALADGDLDSLHTDSKHGLLVGGHVSHDAVDVGNPLKIGGKATTYSNGAGSVADLDRVDASFDLTGAMRTVPAVPGSAWSISNAAAVNAVATATQSAGASGVKHVCTGVQIIPWQDTTGTASAAGGYTWALRDGATGAGTIKASGTFSFTLTASGSIAPQIITFPTPIVGTAATAMCVEITSSALAHTGCTVNAQGYDTK